MKKLRKDSDDCERCSVSRLAHKLTPIQAQYYVWSDVMGESIACADCANEARSLGLSIKAIQDEHHRAPEDHVPGRPRFVIPERMASCMARTVGSKDWQPVYHTGCEADINLQDILKASPNLIPMTDIRTGCSELIVAIPEFGLGSASGDLLAFTAAGDIAVIECKLASNPQIKREVIGQVYEYGSKLWEMSYEKLDHHIASRTGKSLVRSGP